LFCLDTNTCIYFLNGKYRSVKDKILATPPNKIAIPAVVKAELLFGAYKSRKKEENIEKVEQFLEPFEILSFVDMMTYVYADIRQKVESVGISIGPNDLFIAAIVKFYEGMLITNNVQEFSRVDGLNIENWVLP
jgi:tRNA(fMet)-specific endonuclease VapC